MLAQFQGRIRARPCRCFVLGLAALSVVLGPHNRGYRVARLAMILAATGFAESYFLVPAVRDSALTNHSVREEAATWDSLGARVVPSSLVRGELLDHGRWPVLTGLALVGLVEGSGAVHSARGPWRGSRSCGRCAISGAQRGNG